ncbi:MAG: hypothetical protein RR900_07425, partial [Ruthenibacterium sp.]
ILQNKSLSMSFQSTLPLQGATAKMHNHGFAFLYNFPIVDAFSESFCFLAHHVLLHLADL